MTITGDETLIRQGILKSYKDFLPITEHTPMISMGEGGTPLVKSRFFTQIIGCDELYFKLEGCNPSGSFKDRGMVLAVSKALEEGSTAIMCASTGNTSASAAAYGAYCGINTIVLVPKGDIAAGKMAQAMAFHPTIIEVSGTFDQALQMVISFTERNPVTLVNSLNPYRLDGQKTAAFEIVDQLTDAPDYLFIPVGNAGNISAYWTGFSEYRSAGLSSKLTHMMGFQASGASPIVKGEPVANPQTIASAIRIGNPASWSKALNARNESYGVIDSVSDEEIIDAYRKMASNEGIFGEPAAAASLAGLLKMHRSGMDFTDKTVVCVITGTGLKDPDLASASNTSTIHQLPTDENAMGNILSNILNNAESG